MQGMVPVAMCTGEMDRTGTEHRRGTCPLVDTVVPPDFDGRMVDSGRVADNRRTVTAPHRSVHTNATVMTTTDA